MAEYFDVIDKYGNVTGETVSREEAHSKGIRHHTAHVWVVRFNPETDKWQVLLQLRAADKDSFPSMWDTSCAGHIDAGESVDEGMLRELKEELGITATTEDLTSVGELEINYTESFGGTFIDNELAYISCYKVPYENSHHFEYQHEEIQTVIWFDMSMLKDIIDTENFDISICAPKASVKMLLKYFKI